MEYKTHIPFLSVIEGGNTPRKARKMRSGEERIFCKCCEFNDGIPTSEFMPVTTMLMRAGNELKQVITRYACLNCLLKGRKVYLNG